MTRSNSHNTCAANFASTFLSVQYLDLSRIMAANTVQASIEEEKKEVSYKEKWAQVDSAMKTTRNPNQDATTNGEASNDIPV